MKSQNFLAVLVPELTKKIGQWFGGCTRYKIDVLRVNIGQGVQEKQIINNHH